MSDKVTKKKEFTTPPFSSHLLEKLESWVFPVMVSIINIASAKGKMTEIPLP
jgi:hypothetical protein